MPKADASSSGSTSRAECASDAADKQQSVEMEHLVIMLPGLKEYEGYDLVDTEDMCCSLIADMSDSQELANICCYLLELNGCKPSKVLQRIRFVTHLVIVPIRSFS